MLGGGVAPGYSLTGLVLRREDWTYSFAFWALRADQWTAALWPLLWSSTMVAYPVGVESPRRGPKCKARWFKPPRLFAGFLIKHKPRVVPYETNLG